MAHLLLLFHVGLDNYALETHSVVEIIHRVELSKVHGMPAAMAGRFNYHGQIVPVLDMSQLLGGRPSRPALGTRIVLVRPKLAKQGQRPIESSIEFPVKSPADSSAESSIEAGLFGLLVEQVTETLETHRFTQADEGDRNAEHTYFGQTLLYQQQIIQCLRTDQLFTELGYNALSGATSN